MSSSNPQSFIMTTDFATVKNDDYEPATATLPGSTIIAGNGYYENHADVYIPEASATIKGRIQSNKNSDRWMVCNAISMYRFGTVLGFGALYSVDAFFWRISPNTVRCQILIQNPYSDPLTGVAGDEIFNFFFNSFVAPFA